MYRHVTLAPAFQEIKKKLYKNKKYQVEDDKPIWVLSRQRSCSV